jgi:two-component system cell cycle sensor histidine kinase/response regulator CckA
VFGYDTRGVSIRERELNRLFDRSPIGMYRCDEAGRLYYVNEALVRLLGYDSADELLDKNLARDIYVDPEDRIQLLERYRPRGGVEGARVRWRTKQGAERIVQIYGYVLEDPAGACFDASVLDVTEIELANIELRRQRETLETTTALLDTAVRQMRAIYWVVDRELRFLQSGGAIRELLGFHQGRFLGKSIEELHLLAGSTDILEMHRRALAGETVTFATEYLGKHFVTTVCPHRHDDAIVGVVGTSVDVTASYVLERRTIDAQRAESLGVLASGLAHDFNNLLVAILGNTDLALREIPRRGPGRAPVENIRQAGLRAAELIDHLLMYAGHRDVAPTRVPLLPVVEELLRITASTTPDNVAVRCDIARDLVARGDASQIRQVLLNLLNNARDALGARGGTVAISARRIRHDGVVHPDDVIPPMAGHFAEVEIADDGPGMTGETRRRVFDPFFTTKAHGHGLGLAAVAGIVRAHRGGLRLTSAPGEGARFLIRWPCGAAADELPEEAPAEAGRTVLVIDDEDLVRDVVARMIEDLGYAALTATDGPAGLAIIDSQRVDAVLVDLTMPRMSGVAVVDAVRERRPELPIVLCSGFDRDRRGVRADAFLPKPFRIDALDQTLAKLLRAEPALGAPGPHGPPGGGPPRAGSEIEPGRPAT